MNRIDWMRARGAVALSVLLMAVVAAAQAQTAPQRIERTVGVAECAECHKETTRIWEATRHHALFDDTHRSAEGRAIAKAMGVRRTKGAKSFCTDCHYTLQSKGGRVRATAGVSCESCHGAAQDWLERHSEFSGKEEEDETPQEEAARWADAEAAGMIRPHNLYALARNCIGCHITPHEALVNDSDHSAGSAFDLLAWSQGEVRHSVWYSESNDEAAPARKRMLYLAGVAVELERSLAALAQAEQPDGEYFAAMTERARAAAARAKAAADALGLAELKEMAAAGDALGKDSAALDAMAQKVQKHARELLQRDGDDWAALDPLLPTSSDYVGTPVR